MPGWWPYAIGPHALPRRLSAGSLRFALAHLALMNIRVSYAEAGFQECLIHGRERKNVSSVRFSTGSRVVTDGG